MNHNDPPRYDPRPGLTTADLVREALVEGRTLVQTEIALARNDVKHELLGLRKSVMAFFAAVVCGTIGLALLIVAFAIAVAPQVAPPLIVALAMLGVAVAAVVVGIGALPKKPLEHTRERIITDVNVLKETTV